MENFAEGFRYETLQELKMNNLSQYRIFSEWAFRKLAEDPLLYRKIVFTDKANFYLNGQVNKQNCRFWSGDQPEALQKLSMHLKKSHSLVRFMGWWHHWTVLIQRCCES